VVALAALVSLARRRWLEGLIALGAALVIAGYGVLRSRVRRPPRTSERA
jgi:hypothetical protein